MLFFNFLNFFTIFLEFSILGQVRTHPNDFLSFHSFRAFPNLFWFEKKAYWYFLIFLIFVLFFWNSLFRVGQELIETIFFIYFHSLTAILNLFWLEKKQCRCFFYFFAITLEFSIPGRVGTHRNDFFLFSLFLSLSHLILALKEAIIVFFNFLDIFLEFFITGRVRTHRNDFFFLSFSAIPNQFWLENKP